MKALILIITFCSFSIVNLKGQNYFTQIPFFDSCWIYSMDINQAGHMFASASFQNNSRNGVYRSTNDGQSWDFVLSFNLFGNAGLDITNEGIIYALADWGLEGSLYKSTDNGQTWINKMVPLDIYWCNNEIFCQGDDTLF
ncbi:MAG: WD40/YVTN/BNR-like repeat-containing protein, partial [Omnitrophica WOR_2 bacterium]